MAQVEWIKIRVDIFEDEKIRLIEALPEGDTMLVIWIKMLAHAGKINDRGYIYLKEGTPFTPQMLSIVYNRPQTVIDLALKTFQDFGMIEITERGIWIVNWEKHQNIDGLERIRQQNRERKRRQRERERMALPPAPEENEDGSRDSHVTVTSGHATDTDQDIRQDIRDGDDNNPQTDDPKFWNRMGDDHEKSEYEKYYDEILDYYMSKKNRLIIFSPNENEAIKQLFELKVPLDEVKKAVDYAFEVKGKRGVGSFNYCATIVLNRLEDMNKAKAKKVVPFNRQQKQDDDLPKCLRSDYQPEETTEPAPSPEELREKIRKLMGNKKYPQAEAEHQ